MMTIQHRKNKRGLQQLSDAQKMEAITKVQKGETKAAVAREFGVPESTLRGWCKKAKINNGNIHAVVNKSLQVTSTMSPILMTPEVSTWSCILYVTVVVSAMQNQKGTMKRKVAGNQKVLSRGGYLVLKMMAKFLRKFCRHRVKFETSLRKFMKNVGEILED